MKKIVVVSYTTYPDNTPRSFRTNELTRELARQGHEVTLYVLTGGYNYTTYQKETNINVRPLGRTFFFDFSHANGISEIFIMKVFRRLVGKFLEFPSIELALNTYQVLKREENIDLLITIAVPYPLHWGAALFRSKNKDRLANTTWVADCGDPYMGNTFHKRPFYFSYIEKWFCNKVDFISIPLEEARRAYYSEFSDKIKIIPQGFNFDEVEVNKEPLKNTIPVFIYAGIFYKNLRDPRPVLDYLVKLNINFKFIIYTKTPELLKDYISILGDKLQIFGFIPRKELIFKMSSADFLLNLENPSKEQSPSKLIDYALSGSPILSINPNVESDLSKLDEFLSGNYEKRFQLLNIEQYNIKNVASEFLRLAD